jgi:cytochrome c5
MRRSSGIPILSTLGAIVLAAFVGAAPARAQEGPPRALPAGEGRDIAATACSQCHALNVIMSMREGSPGWRRHVTNMVTRGAQLTPREADTVVAYLTTNFGPGSSPAAAAATALPSGPGKELVEARCSACHDLERITIARRHKAEWPTLVANMVGRGAVATPDEAQTITTYLAAHFGE